MPTQSEILRKSSQVVDGRNNILNGKNRCSGYVNNSTTWWTGETGKALRGEYKAIESDITAMLEKMRKLSVSINSLASKVQQADNERQIKLQQQQQLQQNNKVTKKSG